MVFTDKINIVMHDTSQGIYKKNILSKSLNAEVFKSTLGILLIFFFLVVGSRFVGYFEQASEGLLDPNLIYKIVILRIPDFITLLIPLSFFLGVVITISRLYAEREIYGYLSGGFSQNNLIKFIIPQSIILFIITLILSTYIAPYTKELSKEIVSVDTLEEQIESLKPGKIFTFKENDGFIYSDKKNKLFLVDAVLFLSDDNSSSIILAEELNIEKQGSELNLKFREGTLYQNIFASESSITSEFNHLNIPIDRDVNTISGLSLSKLFDYSSKSSKSQMQWNVSIPITILVLLILGVQISRVEPRQGRLSVILPAIFIYIMYLSLLILARESYEEESLGTHNYIWYVHIIFFSFGIFSILRSNASQVSLMTYFFKQKNLIKIVTFIITTLIFLWIVR